MAEPWYQTAFGAHYPLLYGHRDDAEAARCLELLPTLAPLAGDSTGPAARSDGRVLDLGCGDGRHLALLADGTAPVFGLDLSQHLLLAAAARFADDVAAPLVRGDMRALPFRDGVFSSVLSLFTAFGYFGALANHRALLEQVARVLAPRGHWFLDYLDADRVRGELDSGEAAVRVREAGPLQARESRTLAPGKDRVLKTVDIRPVPGQEEAAAALGIPVGGLVYREEVALFAIADLDALARQTGLRRVAGAGSYRGAALGQGDRWILVYQRAGEPVSREGFDGE